MGMTEFKAVGSALAVVTSVGFVLTSDVVVVFAIAGFVLVGFLQAIAT